MPYVNVACDCATVLHDALAVSYEGMMRTSWTFVSSSVSAGAEGVAGTLVFGVGVAGVGCWGVGLGFGVGFGDGAGVGFGVGGVLQFGGVPTCPAGH